MVQLFYAPLAQPPGEVNSSGLGELIGPEYPHSRGRIFFEIPLPGGRFFQIPHPWEFLCLKLGILFRIFVYLFYSLLTVI